MIVASVLGFLGVESWVGQETVVDLKAWLGVADQHNERIVYCIG